jgi:ABC-type antimicrobial peptide transport system permease subunit
LAFWGSAAGFLLAWPVGLALRSLLYGVGPKDPALMLQVPTLLLVVALLAGWGPARRAAKVDPWVVLRAD